LFRVFLFTLMFWAALMTSAHAQSPVVVIGDSRCVGMADVVDDDVLWLAEVGAGHALYWEVRMQLLNMPSDTPVVYMLGVNDLRPAVCVDALTDLISLGFTRVYFATTAPVDDEAAASYGYTVSDAEVRSFNTFVVDNKPRDVRVIDVHEFMNDVDLDTDDGLHFGPEAYELMWSCISRAVYVRTPFEVGYVA